MIISEWLIIYFAVAPLMDYSNLTEVCIKNLNKVNAEVGV